jgi:tRNA(Ile)-lysidine synthase TilS/MesJ
VGGPRAERAEKIASAERALRKATEADLKAWAERHRVPWSYDETPEDAALRALGVEP